MTISFFSLPARAAGRYPQVNARSVQPGSGKGRRCAPPYQAAPWRVRISTPCLHCTPVVLACKGSLRRHPRPFPGIRGAFSPLIPAHAACGVAPACRTDHRGVVAARRKGRRHHRRRKRERNH